MTNEVANVDQSISAIHELFEPIRAFRNAIMQEKTDQMYVQMKDKFAYLPSKYVDDKFNQHFPIHSVKQVDRTEIDGWITYTVEITVAFPNGLTMSRLGTGSSRKQLKTECRLKIEKDPLYKPTVFDYVDNGNASKAALTLSIKNCQERFGIGADITERVIVSKEELDECNATIKTIIEKAISNPRDKSKAKEAFTNAVSPGEKLRLLDALREKYEVEEIIKEVNFTEI